MTVRHPAFPRRGHSAFEFHLRSNQRDKSRWHPTPNGLLAWLGPTTVHRYGTDSRMDTNTFEQRTSLTDRDDFSERTRGAKQVTSLAVSYWHSCVLFAANKLDIFSVLGRRALSAADLAAELSTDVRGTAKLLDACASLGLLDKSADRYRQTAESREFLDRSSPSYLGDWVAHWADMLAKGNWQQLAEHVSHGEPLTAADQPFQFDPHRDPLDNWVLGMGQMASAGHADCLCSSLSLAQFRNMLDVGAGPGSYSIELCRRYPNLQVTIVDSDDVMSVTRRLVIEAGFAERFRFISGDFRLQQLGHKFDAILLSNVLHMCQREGALEMLRNAASHLTQDGVLIIQEWMLNSDNTKPVLSALFNLHLFINPDADLFSESDLRHMLQSCGFSRFDTVRTAGIYDLILARRT